MQGRRRPEASDRRPKRAALGRYRGGPMSHSDVFVIGAGPAGLTAAYLLTKQGVADHRPRGRPALRRRHLPHRQLQGLPLRHRRPPLLLQVEGGRGPLDRDPARRHARAAALVAHLLQRQVLLLPAEGRRGADASSASSRAPLCVLSYLYKPGLPDREARRASRTG